MKLKKYAIAILFLLAMRSVSAAEGDKVTVDLTQAPDQPFMLIATMDTALDAKKTEAILTNSKALSDLAVQGDQRRSQGKRLQANAGGIRI